jgi:hypothetical protein
MKMKNKIMEMKQEYFIVSSDDVSESALRKLQTILNDRGIKNAVFYFNGNDTRILGIDVSYKQAVLEIIERSFSKKEV